MAALVLFLLWAGHAQAAWTAIEAINATVGKPLTLPPGLKAHPEIIQWGYRKTLGDSSITLCEKLGNESRHCIPPFNSRMELTPDYELRIYSVLLSDVGIYRMVVWYIWDEMNRSVLKLHVYETISNVSIRVTRGSDFSNCHLHCKAQSGSQIVYTWYSKGAKVTNDEFHTVSNKGESLTVDVSVVAPVGHSFYQCTASNPVSWENHAVDLKRDCSTGKDILTLPTWAIVILSILGLFVCFVLFLCACFFWCRDVRWFLRRRRAWFNPPQAQYPTGSSITSSFTGNTSSKREVKDPDSLFRTSL